MIIGLLAFLADFLCASFFQQVVVYSLAAYFFVMLALHEQDVRDFYFNIIPSGALLLFQGFFLHDRFGLMVTFIIPLVLTAYILNRIVIHPGFLLPLFSCYFFICQDFLIKKYLFLQKFHIGVTIEKILINLIVGYLVLWGIQGNRSLQRK